MKNIKVEYCEKCLIEKYCILRMYFKTCNEDNSWKLLKKNTVSYVYTLEHLIKITAGFNKEH